MNIPTITGFVTGLLSIPCNSLSVLACSVLLLPGCIIYRNCNRNVTVWDSHTGRTAASKRFSFSHATPAIYLPKAPEPVEAQLDANGSATVTLPAVAGWAGTTDNFALIDGKMIRDGGTFPLYQEGTAGSKPSNWRITIGKPQPKTGSNQAGGISPQGEKRR